MFIWTCSHKHGSLFEGSQTEKHVFPVHVCETIFTTSAFNEEINKCALQTTNGSKIIAERSMQGNTLHYRNCYGEMSMPRAKEKGLQTFFAADDSARRKKHRCQLTIPAFCSCEIVPGFLKSGSLSHLNGTEPSSSSPVLLLL